ncbi:MAG: DUF5916 domain-containing protein [Gemmatimonadaceae bacterium]
MPPSCPDPVAHRSPRLAVVRVLALVLFAGVTSAQSPAPAGGWPAVRRTTDAIRLDGRLDEAEWAIADSIWEFKTKEPTEGGTPSERTVVRLLATPQGLAVGWWNYDRDVAGRRRSQLRRDAELRSDDYVSLMVDGLRDKRSAFYFRTNSNGALWDGEHINQERGNEEWDGIWDARTATFEGGWTAEMLIPWGTLRYPGDVSAMGMNFRRFLPRTNEEVLWRAWKRGQGYRFLEDEGVVEGFADLPRRPRAEYRPFALIEAAVPERTLATDGSLPESAPGRTALSTGLDVKVAVTNTLTADVTVFPDFAQAEVDRQVVNLTRFPLFFPEQRPFFTEGAAIFAFGREQQAQLFYSRRVGLGDRGSPVAIPFGARMQGRVGRNQLGFLAVRTGDDERATDLVARVRHDVLGRGYVGAMTTYSDRAARPGALGAGVDVELPFIVRERDNLIVLGSAAWSRDSVGGAGGAHYRVVIDYPNDHADIVTRFDRVETGYDPVLGFVSQRGIQRLSGQFAITPRPAQPSPIRRWEFNLLGYDLVWDLGGRLDNASLSVRPVGMQLQSGDRFEVNLSRRFDGPTADFTLVPGTTIAAGDYWFDRAEVRFSGANVRPWSLGGAASTGGFYEGTRVDVSVNARLRLQPHWEFSLDLARNDVVLPTRGFVATTVRFRGDYAYSPRLTGTLFTQYDDQSDRASVNARVRWTTSPGSDLYVVWNSTWPTGLDRGIPWGQPLRGGLIAKYVRYLR